MAGMEDRNYRGRNYIEGNVVRLAYPERIPEPDRKKKPAPERKPKPRNKAKRISSVFAFVSAAAGVVLMAAVVNCISVQAEITNRLENISSLESELLDMKESNSQMETKISLLTDATYIYNTATVKLGMVPASEDSVIYFDRTENEYVIQNEYVPK